MDPMTARKTSKQKKKVVRTTIELKKEIIGKYERGTRVSDLAVQYNMAKSTISTFLKHKDVIKKADVAKGVKGITKQRPPIVDEIEKLLLIWVNGKQLAGDSVSDAMIYEKAKSLHADLLKDRPGLNSENKFTASRGWFTKFKKRSGIHSVVKHGETACIEKQEKKTTESIKLASAPWDYLRLHEQTIKGEPSETPFDPSEIVEAKLDEEKPSFANSFQSTLDAGSEQHNSENDPSDNFSAERSHEDTPVGDVKRRKKSSEIPPEEPPCSLLVSLRGDFYPQNELIKNLQDIFLHYDWRVERSINDLLESYAESLKRENFPNRFNQYSCVRKILSDFSSREKDLKNDVIRKLENLLRNQGSS